MKVLIIGATGTVGIELIRACLDASHQVIVYARSPQKLPQDLQTHPSVHIVQGSLTDADALRDALTNVHVVVSALGPAVNKGPLHPSDTPLAKAYALLLGLMRDTSVKRLIALGTASNKDTSDKFSIDFWILVNGVATFARPAYKDVVAIGETIRADHDVLWTIARVPILTNKSIASFHAGYIGDGTTKPFLSRKAYAAFVVRELENNEWIKKSPMISSG